MSEPTRPRSDVMRVMTPQMLNERTGNKLTAKIEQVVVKTTDR